MKMRFTEHCSGWLAAMSALMLYASAGVTWAQEASAPATASEPAGDTAPTAGTGSAATADAPAAPASEVTPEPKPHVATIPIPEPSATPEERRDSPDYEAGIPEVIVTATKREESVRKIPATVNVLSGEDLEAVGARELQDYLRYVPGIAMQEGEQIGLRAISIRGIAPQPGANSTTGVLIENVAVADPYGSFLIPDLDPFDLYNLEVLKGPQGTLFGASALNGAIRFVMNKPQLDVVEGKGLVSYYDQTQGSKGLTWGAALNAPIGDTMALRLVGFQQQIPGLYDDINANGKNEPDSDKGEKEMYRVLGLWQPTDELSVNAFFLRQDLKKNNISFASSSNGSFVRDVTPGDSIAIQNFDLANVVARYDFDWLSVIAEASLANKLVHTSFDGGYIAAAAARQGIESARVDLRSNTQSIGYELRILSPSGDSPWAWLGGAYLNEYQGEALFGFTAANTAELAALVRSLDLPALPTDPVGTLFPGDVGLAAIAFSFNPLKAREESLFGEITRRFFDHRLALTLGGRYYRQKLNITSEGKGAGGAATLLLFGDIPPELKEKGFSPKASVAFQWSPNLLLYATVARGFQFGGVNGPALVPTDNVYDRVYKPSTVWSHELGVRTDWLDRTLQIDATGFLINWTDMQLRQSTPAANSDYIDNVGRARSIGVESSIQWLTPIRGLKLVNAASYIRATIVEEYTTADDRKIPAGSELPAAPRLQTATTLAYSTPIWGFLGGASVSYTHQDKAWNTITQDQRIFGYETIDAGINLSAPKWSFAPELAFNVSNVADTRALIGARRSNLGPDTARLGTELIQYNKPRAFILRLVGRF